jgi:hypothetical protein
MNLKTSNQLAIENFEPIVNSYDLKLLGSPNLYSNENNSFASVFGNDVKFFYKAVVVKNNAIVKYEVGLGYLENNILKRFNPLYHGLLEGPLPSSNGPQYFFADKDESLVVTSHVPTNFNELLCDPNCVITSVAPHISHPVHIPNHSLLGRLDDNVQSIPFSELFSNPELIAAILQVITTYSKQLSLRTSKLDAKRLCTDSLQLNSNDKILDKKGTLGFDGKDLKFYDGEAWRILEWRSCQE